MYSTDQVSVGALYQAWRRAAGCFGGLAPERMPADLPVDMLAAVTSANAVREEDEPGGGPWAQISIDVYPISHRGTRLEDDAPAGDAWLDEHGYQLIDTVVRYGSGRTWARLLLRGPGGPDGLEYTSAWVDCGADVPPGASVYDLETAAASLRAREWAMEHAPAEAEDTAADRW